MSIKSPEARQLASERRAAEKERTLTRSAARAEKSRAWEAFA